MIYKLGKSGQSHPFLSLVRKMAILKYTDPIWFPRKGEKTTQVPRAESELSPPAWTASMLTALACIHMDSFPCAKWCIDITAFMKRSFDHKCVSVFEGGSTSVVFNWWGLNVPFFSKSSSHPSHRVNAQGARTGGLRVPGVAGCPHLLGTHWITPNV